MLKKIQKYLLINYPLLWNTKIVPMGSVVIIFNLILFLVGFISGTIDFQEYNYYKQSINNTITFLFIGLTSILISIVWLVYYLKNNAFKSFYPKKSISLYYEWAIIFIIFIMTILPSYTYLLGQHFRLRTYATEQEVIKANQILNKVDILLPESDSNYYKYNDTEDSSETIDSANRDSLASHTKTSLLNYTYYGSNVEYEKIIQWLKNEKKDSIQNLMNEYLNLEKQHNLKTNLTIDSWMKLIYNPPYYPISSSNYIFRYKSIEKQEYYTEYNVLVNNYERLQEAYSYSEPFQGLLITLLYISLSLSILLFSFKVTSGKAWLISIVSAGILLFINGILIVLYNTIFSNNTVIFIVFYWVFLFICMMIYLIERVYTKKTKGKSTVILNLILWLFPFILLICYAGYMDSHVGRYYNEVQDRRYTPVYKFFTDHPFAFPWINLTFVVICLLFFMKTIKKWRALPEE